MTNTSIIKQFVTDEFAPDVAASDLDVELDLLSSGVIDSLGLLKLIAWIEATFDVTVDDAALDPDNFRTVAAIDAFIEQASVAQAAAG
jgi:acyl carrier protein